MAGICYTNTNTVIRNRMYKLRLGAFKLTCSTHKLQRIILCSLLQRTQLISFFFKNHTQYKTKFVGIPNKYKIFAPGEVRHWAAIVVTNTLIDTLLILQLSDMDTVVLEVIIDNTKIILVSMYLDISQQIDEDLTKIEAIIQHVKGVGLLTAMDSNSRSTTWHDTLTNIRGRTLEEFIISQQLHILNEESKYTTFQSSHGSSNIDLTIVSKQLLRAVWEWEICYQDSCSDHSIIQFAVGQGKGNRLEIHFQDVRYIVQKCNIEKFQANLIRLAGNKICKINSKKKQRNWIKHCLHACF